jgi:hypothetical protein
MKGRTPPFTQVVMSSPKLTAPSNAKAKILTPVSLKTREKFYKIFKEGWVFPICFGMDKMGISTSW